MAINQDHVSSRIGRQAGGVQAGDACPDHQHIAEQMLLRSFPRCRLGVDPAQPRNLAKPGIPLVPGAPRPVERAVVETHRQPSREPLDHGAQVKAQAAKRVLGADAHAGLERLVIGADIAGPRQLHQSVRLGTGQGHQSARAMIFERPAEQVLAVGGQRAGDGVAFQGAQLTALKMENQLPVRPHPGAGLTFDAAAAFHGVPSWPDGNSDGGNVRTTVLLRVSRSARNQKEEGA